MLKHISFLLFFFLTQNTYSNTNLQMNRAFEALSELIPYITNESNFVDKKNEKTIHENLLKIQNAFKAAGHENMVKKEVFLPSYKLVQTNLKESLDSYKKGQKELSLWRLKELTSLCLDCHTRLPSQIPSSYELQGINIDPYQFDELYNLGIAQLIIRRYVDAKNTFTKSIDQKIMKGEMRDLVRNFKQILLIEVKVLRNPQSMLTLIEHYKKKKGLPSDLIEQIKSWEKQLQRWVNKKITPDNLKSEKDIESFIQKVAMPLREIAQLEEGYDVDHLFISGYLSNFLFLNPDTRLSPDLNYWIGRSEKYLKKEQFFGSGDLFFKQCILKYPQNPRAQECFKEYSDSVEFEFSGSSGTHVPNEIKNEINKLKQMIEKKK